MIPRFLTLEDCLIILSPTMTDNPLKSCFTCGDRKTLIYVLDS